jgi:hypothetical protein
MVDPSSRTETPPDSEAMIPRLAVGPIVGATLGACVGDVVGDVLGELEGDADVAISVGTSTKQRLQSVRTELVVLPQVVVAVYVAEDEDAPYCLPCGTLWPHATRSQQVLSLQPPAGQFMEAWSLTRCITLSLQV